jgi:hypothetical protein
MAEVLERGNIYFIYRPKVEHTSAAGLEDIQRFFVILSPFGKARHRLIVIGRKKLPAIGDDHERNWGFVQKVESKPQDIEDELDRLTHSTATPGERLCFANFASGQKQLTLAPPVGTLPAMRDVFRIAAAVRFALSTR